MEKNYRMIHFSFEVSNQKVQANLDEFGTIRHITFFHGNYLMESKPGVWGAKDFVRNISCLFL